MAAEEKINLVTLDGEALLTGISLYKEQLILDADLVSNISESSESALLYQIAQAVKEKKIQQPLRELFFFVNFGELFRRKGGKDEERFNSLLENGFTATWYGSEHAEHYVPFEKSQSQAKNCVISFIHKDLFEAVRRRLDLDICFGDMDMPGGLYAEEARHLPSLSKLYAYRGLYLSEAIRLDGPEIEALLNEDSIIVLHESSISFPDQRGKEKQKQEILQARQMQVYSKKTNDAPAQDTQVDLDQMEDIIGSADGGDIEETDIKIDSLFDGAGMISPRGAWILNEAMGKTNGEPMPEQINGGILRDQGLAVSFQFRMPFCKGMLHTVDFHRFFKEEIIKKQLKESGYDGDLEEKSKQLFAQLEVTDVFGKQRKLADAQIILNTSLFKLFKLLKKRSRGPELITHYFNKVKEYGHSIYIAKTDLQQRYTGYVNLTYQILSTLLLSTEAFDDLVRHHLERARKYDLNEIILGGWKPLSEDEETESKDRLEKFLRANRLLALDNYVSDLIASSRRQKIDTISQGKVSVEGDMRFLCRDLMHWLCLIAADCGFDKKIAKKDSICRGEIYLPGVQKEKFSLQVQKQCAVFRSPHLSPNENVLSVVAREDSLHRRYLGHLWRVAFLGAYSHMHSALGGADFDGDMVVVAFQPSVVEACERKCYREDGQKSLELINIPAIDRETSAQQAFNYIDTQTVNNTFSNNIGKISNATMKICAAESVLEAMGLAAVVEKLPYTSKYCTILNGVEIDAAKSGVRPDLKGVMGFVRNPENAVKDGVFETISDLAVAKEIAPEAAQKVKEAMDWVTGFLHIKEILEKESLADIKVTLKEEKSGKQTYEVTKRTSATVKVATIDAGQDKPLVYRLLHHWAQARIEEAQLTAKPKGGQVPEMKKQAVEELYRKLLETDDREQIQSAAQENKYNYPRAEITKKKVFRCPAVDEKTRTVIDGVLAAGMRMKQTVSGLGLEERDELSSALRKRMLYLLQFKYDSLASGDDQCSLRNVPQQIVDRLKNRCGVSAQLEEQLESRFYGDDMAQSWLFMGLDERKQLLTQIYQICAEDEQALHVFTDFYGRGYNLLYFAMREALAAVKVKENTEKMNTEAEDPFSEKLRIKVNGWLKEGYSVSQINNRQIPKACAKELREQLQMENEQLIPLIYDCSKDAKLLWQMFSWEQIKPCVEVKKHAQ